MSCINFTMCVSDTVGNARNAVYPKTVNVTDIETFRNCVAHDHTYAVFKDGYRKIDNFIYSDAVVMECDNDHSDNETEWVTPNDVAETFHGVPFIVHYSRHHNKPKKSKSARPRFHVVFAINRITDANEYAFLKRKLFSIFPYFDDNALDSARFFFGTSDAEVVFFDGENSLDNFLKNIRQQTDREIITEGSRNSTLYQRATKIVKRYGDSLEAYEKFLEESEKCSPPLPGKELESIWNNALKFFHGKVETQENYIKKDDYARKETATLRPSDYTDVGQAEIIAKEYNEQLRYSEFTDFICYSGTHWNESNIKAQGLVQKLTRLQLKEAQKCVSSAKKSLDFTGANDLIARKGKSAAEKDFNKAQRDAYRSYRNALEYFAFATKRRNSNYISAALKEARPMLEIEADQLDKNPFLLNTPSGTYDLRYGTDSRRDHNHEDYISKITAVSPSDKGAEEWQNALKLFFCNDDELISYVQKIVGLAIIGKVYVETLIIAYGEGSNGKSTFWNVILRSLGSYGGNISADTLTAGCKRNVKPELAEAKGKRLLIAAELEEGQRLSTSTIKHLCSTDEIEAEKKYKAPFSFIPTHTLVLYTNHLPKVGANDPGTWRRLLVIPFNAKITGNSDIKNYADYLYENCAEAVLKWAIEGAKAAFDSGFHFEQPQIVKSAIEQYRESNDWLEHFISERCEVDESFRERSGDLYTAYRNYSSDMGEYSRSTSDFYSALELAGFKKHRTSVGRYILGLKLKDSDEEGFPF